MHNAVHSAVSGACACPVEYSQTGKGILYRLHSKTVTNLQEGLEAPPEEEQLADADLALGNEEDLSFASMFNSMRLEEAEEPLQAAQPRNIQQRTPMADLDPVIPYGSFGQVLMQWTL